VDGDRELAGCVATKKAAFDAAWAEKFPGALAKGLEALESCYVAIQADPEGQKNPNVIHALAGAFRICAEVYLTGKIVDERLGRSHFSDELGPLSLKPATFQQEEILDV